MPIKKSAVSSSEQSQLYGLDEDLNNGRSRAALTNKPLVRDSRGKPASILGVTVGQHGFCNLDKSRNICPSQIINSVILLTILDATIMDALHDSLQTLI